jgi:hypothetical protein
MPARHESVFVACLMHPKLTSSDALGGSSSQPGGILCKLTSDAFEVCWQESALRHLGYSSAAETESHTLEAKAKLHTSSPAPDRHRRGFRPAIG